jgi:hypothetical protein
MHDGRPPPGRRRIKPCPQALAMATSPPRAGSEQTRIASTAGSPGQGCPSSGASCGRRGLSPIRPVIVQLATQPARYAAECILKPTHIHAGSPVRLTTLVAMKLTLVTARRVGVADSTAGPPGASASGMRHEVRRDCTDRTVSRRQRGRHGTAGRSEMGRSCGRPLIVLPHGTRPYRDSRPRSAAAARIPATATPPRTAKSSQ